MTVDLLWDLGEPDDPGSPPIPPATYGEIFRDRVLWFLRADTTLRSIVGVPADRTEAIVERLEDLRDAFDLETATGDRLDKLGTYLQLTRQGADDDLYRKLLQIQALLILARAATTPNLLEIVRLYTGFEAPEYSEFNPMTFRIGAIVADLADAQRLVSLLRRGKAGAYAMQIAPHIGTDPTGNVLLVDSDQVTITDPGNVDSDQVSIDDNYPITWTL